MQSAWFSGLLVSTKCHLNTSESRWFLIEQGETVKWESTFKKDAKIWWNVTLWPLFSVQQLSWTHEHTDLYIFAIDSFVGGSFSDHQLS
jgi:hypothetical protein